MKFTFIWMKIQSVVARDLGGGSDGIQKRLAICRCLLYDSFAPARIKETVFKRSAARRPVVLRCLLGVEAVSKYEINGFSDREYLTNSDVWSSDRIERTVR